VTCTAWPHSFALNSGSGSITITGVPAVYEAGQEYTITVRVSHPDRRRWGFQLAAYSDALRTVGSFVITDATRTRLLVEDGETYVQHTNAGTAAGTSGGASWSFRWRAPEAGVGTVTFYAAGNAASRASRRLRSKR
jgi:hypothetical protein